MGNLINKSNTTKKKHIQDNIKYNIDIYQPELINIDNEMTYCYDCDSVIISMINYHCSKCNKCHNKQKQLHCKVCKFCIDPYNDNDIIYHKKNCPLFT